ncbi:hypothetical protein LZ30DRAFT_601731 [Colletotrichum cereale]|nr:hypothetical protein LZ30DRAFT_601731 [Colletotrichum cereale]
MSSPGPRILTFALENRPHYDGPATRASRPKVRTGCVTCKRRRIKCDEAKPSCLNCLKRKVACEGYHQPQPPVRLAGPALPAEPSYQGVVFATQLQKDHFDQWLSFAADVLVFPSELITGTIPQIARADPAVRNAAFAIGAAALGSRTREDRLAGRGPYYPDALRYYNRALALTARSPPTGDTFPGVLVTCLLFVMFEALQGNRRAALMHLNYGSNILDHYDERVAGRRRRRDPLVEAVTSNFQRLTLQSWSHNGDHPRETAERVPWCCRGRAERYAVDEMPDSFDSLDEAHRWWETTQHHVIHHAPILIGFRVEGTGNKAPSFPAGQSLPIPPEQVKGHERFIEDWRARFRPLLKAQTWSDVDDRERLQTLGLRIQSTYLSIPTVTANYTDAEALARMTPAFRRCVALCEEFLRLQSRLAAATPGAAGAAAGAAAGETFTMDSNGPTWPLGAAAMLCLDKGVQADALRLLRGFPRRDGLWDTRVFVGMLRSYRAYNLGTAGVEGGEENKGRHQFDVEVVYEEESVLWIKNAEDPSGVVGPGELEHRISLP